MCHRFTIKDKAINMPVMNEIEEARQNCAEERYPCSKCKASNPKWRCLDCKNNFCEDCRNDHHVFELLQAHRWSKFLEPDKPVVDKIEFCYVHKTKPIEVHCQDCRRPICYKCSITEHKAHTLESVPDALKRVVPAVKDTQTKVQIAMNAAKIATKQTQDQMRVRRSKELEHHDYVEDKMNRKYEECLAKLNEDHAYIQRLIATSRQETTDKYNKYIRQLFIKQKSGETMVEISKVVLDTCQNTSLLMAIQAGMLEILKTTAQASQAKDKEDELPDPEPTNISFIPSRLMYENFLGEITDEPSSNFNLNVGSGNSARVALTVDTIPKISYNDVDFKMMELEVQASIDFYSFRIAIVNEEIWCVEHITNNIHVLSITDGSLQRTIENDTIDKCRSVTQFRTGALVATTSGLFLFNPQANADEERVHVSTLILSGQFCDVTVRGNDIYALDEMGRVQVLKYTATINRFKFQIKFDLRDYNFNSRNTIEVTEEHVYVGYFWAHIIQQYTLTGEFVKTHGRHGKQIGLLHNPLLCGSDRNGEILVAESSNNRLQILKGDDTWRMVHIQDLGSQPCCARFFDDRLFVMLFMPRMLQVFVQDQLSASRSRYSTPSSMTSNDRRLR